jgi:hypothetical protein
MNTLLTTLLPVLGAVLCAAAGACLSTESASLFGFGAMFCAGLALILWQRMAVVAILLGAAAAVLGCVDQIRQFALGQQSLVSFILYASIVLLSVIGVLIERWQTRRRIHS